jgi:hypothetical protein
MAALVASSFDPAVCRIYPRGRRGFALAGSKSTGNDRAADAMGRTGKTATADCV